MRLRRLRVATKATFQLIISSAANVTPMQGTQIANIMKFLLGISSVAIELSQLCSNKESVGLVQIMCERMFLTLLLESKGYCMKLLLRALIHAGSMCSATCEACF